MSPENLGRFTMRIANTCDGIRRSDDDESLVADTSALDPVSLCHFEQAIAFMRLAEQAMRLAEITQIRVVAGRR